MKKVIFLLRLVGLSIGKITEKNVINFHDRCENNILFL